jgi:WD40 repeat protein
MVPHGEEENLPKNLTFFEVSPDEKQVLVGGYDGEVSVLTLATGDVQEWQKAGDYNLMGAPVWRNAEEITYARRNPTADGKMPVRKAEIVLRKAIPGKGDQEKVLSRDWSSEMLESIYSGSDRNSKGP